MTQTISHPYVVYNTETRDYLFLLEETNRLVTGAAFENAYCHPPATFEQEIAEALAVEMNAGKGTGAWKANITHADCPSCGRDLWDNDLDVCYPQNRERTSWRVGCNCHDFGCGLELTAATYEDVVTQWNTQVLYHYDAERYVKPTGRRFYQHEKFLKDELQVAEDLSEEDFLTLVGQLGDNDAAPLKYVALHYLAMVAARKAWF